MYQGLTMILITLLGQTASGKSEMAVDLAKKLEDSWIVSCDSRQVYKGLDIGTGKVEGAWEKDIYYYKDIPHFLIDFVDPKKYYSLADYLEAWTKLFQKEVLPKYVILTGGTGLYAKAIVEKYQVGKIKPEFAKQIEVYKKNLEKLSIGDLQGLYNKSLSKESQNLNESDYHNPRRLQNLLLREKGKQLDCYTYLTYPKFEKTYQFAIKIDQSKLKEKIYKRLIERIVGGMVEEIKKLDLPTQRFLDLGLEYRTTKLHLLGQIDETWKEKLATEIYQYAKRQLTWLKKQNITWITTTEDILKEISQ